MSTDAFSAIQEDFECVYLTAKKIENINLFPVEAVIGKYSIDKGMVDRHYRFLNTLTWKYRNKSSSFYFRAMREQRLQFGFLESDGFFYKSIKSVWRIVNWAYKYIVRAIYDNNLIYPFYFKLNVRKLIINAALEEMIASCNPDVVLFPCSAYDPDGTDVIRICKKICVPVIYLVDNWDNLSSKSILWERPSYVGVWGEQSGEHAVNIQGFKKEQVTLLGTPRFDKYFKVRDKYLKSNFCFKYILFVGTALAFDEADVLQKLNDIISKHQNIFSSVKIIYRPHPWRQGSDSIAGKDLKNVVIDPQMINSYNHIDSSNFQPDLTYYPSLLKNAEFVLGGLTSMLIEAMIFRKRFMALVYDDGKNYTNQQNAFKYYTHFQGLRDVEAISFCENTDDLEAIFISTWMARKNIDKEKIDLQRRYFYFDDSRTYSHRLRDLCVDVVDNYHKSTLIS